MFLYFEIVEQLIYVFKNINNYSVPTLKIITIIYNKSDMEIGIPNSNFKSILYEFQIAVVISVLNRLFM